MIDPDVRPIEQPLAELERRIIDDYLRGAGHDPVALRARHDAIPFVAVIGDRELADGTLAIRARDRKWSAPAAAAIAELQGAVRSTV